VKKSVALLIVLIVSINLLAGCGGGNIKQTSPPEIETSTKKDPPGGDNSQTPAPESTEDTKADKKKDPPSTVETYITDHEARSILQTWVDSHPFQLGAEIDPDEYLLPGEKQGEDYSDEFYRFYLSITRLGVAEILVHKETGELFHLDSPYSSVGFGPIDDWYNKDHAGYEPSLSVSDAREIYNVWLNNHAEMSEYTISLDHEIYGDGAYYWFQAENPEWYWYNILVDMETGELLFMMTPDGEDPAPDIEPLDDYYNRYYD
jgi:hypothetical protein